MGAPACAALLGLLLAPGGARAQTAQEADRTSLLAFKAGGDADNILESWTADTWPCGAGWDCLGGEGECLGWIGIRCFCPGEQDADCTAEMDKRVQKVSLASDSHWASGLAGDVAHLAAIDTLDYINLRDCTGVIGDVGAFAALGAVISGLYLQMTGISGSIAPLAACTGLTHLSVEDTDVFGDPAILRAIPGLGADWGTDPDDALRSSHPILGGFTHCQIHAQGPSTHAADSVVAIQCDSGALRSDTSKPTVPRWTDGEFYIGRTQEACCEIICDRYACPEASHLKPNAPELELYTEEECCDADLCAGNADANDDFDDGCTHGSPVPDATTTVGATEDACCQITCSGNDVGQNYTCQNPTNLLPDSHLIIAYGQAECCSPIPPPPCPPSQRPDSLDPLNFGCCTPMDDGTCVASGAARAGAALAVLVAAWLA